MKIYLKKFKLILSSEKVEYRLTKEVNLFPFHSNQKTSQLFFL